MEVLIKHIAATFDSSDERVALLGKPPAIPRLEIGMFMFVGALISLIIILTVEDIIMIAPSSEQPGA